MEKLIVFLESSNDSARCAKSRIDSGLQPLIIN